MGGNLPPNRLLDRSAEIDVIFAALASGRAGSGTALLVEGTAGIGKTSLLAYACEQAASAGMTVLAARAAEFESGYAWGVVRQLFEPEIRGRDEMLAGDAAQLAAPALSHGAQLAAEDPFPVLHGLYWLTAAMARRAPLLLAIDDLHWADQPSLRFIAHIARRLEGLPVTLMLTVREPRSASVQDKALIAALAAEPGLAVLRPRVLSTAACGELVAAALGSHPSAAFQEACRQLTGGNPLLLGALLTSLAAEGIRGHDGDLAHLRRPTPDTVSRNVLLQLGRMPASALAVARAIAVLGTAATTARAGRLADLGRDAGAEAIAALMAEQLVEGEHALRYVHPLVRSAVYLDLAAPVRQRWHARAAHILDAEGAALEEVTVHLLASAPGGDAWVVRKLRAAAADARGSGAPDVAILCLERALAEPPAAAVRPDVLFELGTLEILQGAPATVSHLTEALAGATALPRRAETARLLSEALALGGQFVASVDLLTRAVEEAGSDQSREGLQATLFTMALMDHGTRLAIQPMLKQVQARAARGEELNPRLHASLALELEVAGQDREGAVRSARAVLAAVPRLMQFGDGSVSEAISVLLYADHLAEAEAAVRSWLDLARQRGSEPAAAVAAGFASTVALFRGEVSQAVAYGMQGLAGTTSIWIATIFLPNVIRGLMERGELDQARELLAEHGLTGDLLPFWPHNLVRHARACLRAAAGDHAAAAQELLEAGQRADESSIFNPAVMSWRSDAALSLAALGDQETASRLCADEIDLARKWGAPRALGIALRAAGVVASTGRGIELLTEAVRVLRPASAPLELARALVDLGSAHRRAGGRGTAREFLREGLDLAHRQGGLRLAERAREELVIAGGKPRRAAIRGRDALTPSELRVAELAGTGQTNRQIAQALFITQRTVENHLTSSYAKLGIRSRSGLGAALAGSAAGVC